MVTKFPTIALGSRRKKELTPIARVLTSPATTPILGGLLLTILPGGRALKVGKSVATGLIRGAVGVGKFIGKSFVTSPVKTTLGLASAPFIVGLATTPEAKEFVTGGFRRGQKTPETIRGLGGILAESPKTALASAVGVGAVATLGTSAILKAIRDKPVTPPTIIAAAPPISTEALQPLGAVQPPQPIAEVPAAVKKEKPMKITNTFNPEINISFKKSKKFINQQVLLN